MSGLKRLVRHHYYRGYPSGLGDYFRSGLVAYKYYKMSFDKEGRKNDYSFFFEGHPLDRYLKSIELNRNIYETEGILRTNSYEMFSKVHIDEVDKREFKQMIEDLLTPEIKKEIEEEYNRYPHDIAIHCRTGDQFSKVPNPHIRIKDYDDAFNDIVQLRKNISSDLKIRLFTDNLEIRERVSMSGLDIYVSSGTIMHTAYDYNNLYDEKDPKDTIMDFILIMKSSLIYTFLSSADNKRYLSTFSFFPAYLCNIPIRVVYKDTNRDTKCNEVIKEVLYDNDYFADKFVSDKEYTKSVITDPIYKLS